MPIPETSVIADAFGPGLGLRTVGQRENAENISSASKQFTASSRFVIAHA
jgi:hypothetical protein